MQYCILNLSVHNELRDSRPASNVIPGAEVNPDVC